MGIGKRIQTVRGDVSREDFAAVLGIHAQTLGRYERGERLPDSDFVKAVCEKYGVNPAWLLLGEGEMYSKPAGLLGQLLAEGRGSRSIEEMAKLLYVTPEQLQRYEQNLERPDAAFLKLFLLFAQGDKVKLSAKLDFAVGIANLADELRKTAQAQQPEPPPALDMDRMKLAIEAVEEGLAGRTIDPAKKANIILAAYDLLVEPTEEAKGKVLKFIRAAA
jgi:transcriptional regulator with XRE-family HTH domain